MTWVAVGRCLMAVFTCTLLAALPLAAQDRPLEVFVGWAPVFGDHPAENHVLKSWAVSLSGGAGGQVSPVFEASGWYFFPSSGTIHNFLGGVRRNLPAKNGARPFAQIIAGPMVFHAGGTAYGLAIVPGGGVDVPVPRHRFAIRIQGDYFGMYAQGDYGRFYWGHVWRASTGFVFLRKK